MGRILRVFSEVSQVIFETCIGKDYDNCCHHVKVDTAATTTFRVWVTTRDLRRRRSLHSNVQHNHTFSPMTTPDNPPYIIPRGSQHTMRVSVCNNDHDHNVEEDESISTSQMGNYDPLRHRRMVNCPGLESLTQVNKKGNQFLPHRQRGGCMSFLVWHPTSTLLPPLPPLPPLPLLSFARPMAY